MPIYKNSVEFDISGHAAIGNNAQIDNDIDTSTLTLSDIQTQVIDHAIGLSNTVRWDPASNANSRNLVVIDTLAVPNPPSGVTIPQSIALSANHWIGADANSLGTITEIIGLRVNASVQLSSADLNVDRQYGIRIDDQSLIAGTNNIFPTRSAAIRIANQNWIKSLDVAGTSDVSMIRVNDEDNVEIGTRLAQTVAFHGSTASITAQNVIAAGSITLTLPDAANNTGVVIRIKNVGADTITIASAGGTNNGSGTIAASAKAGYISNGVDWYDF